MEVILGDCLTVLKSMSSASYDSMVTDPPAGIGFMGKAWDGDKGGRAQWIAWMSEVLAETLRVLKPGAHALVWAIPRTSHWTATALEDAGFEIRDVVTHLFGTGFPKSLDVSKAIDKEAGAEREVIGEKIRADGKVAGLIKPMNGGALLTKKDREGSVVMETAPATDAARQWQGFGTALKPACEFWILCRKPLGEKTVAKNVLKHGTGALNIDGCRIGVSSDDPNHRVTQTKGRGFQAEYVGGKVETTDTSPHGPPKTGRFPSHLVIDEEAAQALDEQSGHLHGAGNKKAASFQDNGMFGNGITRPPRTSNICDMNGGGASRFFYIAKASKSDRGAGNTHPTVKSTKLMSYLVRLITPPGGTVLDPFMGSGSTGVAAQAEGMRFVGIEQDEAYYRIALDRIKAS